MNILNHTMWNRRLPSFIGAFFLIFAFGTITWLSRNAILFGTKAAVDETPKNIMISNITDTAFTVSYTTDANVAGTVNFGKDAQTQQIAFDTRDTATGVAHLHRAHYISVQGLTPSTKYFFSITSGSKNFLNNGTPYEITTGTTLTDASTQQKVLTGKVTLATGSIPSEAIAYLSSDTTQTASTLIDADGTYHLAMSSLRTKELTSFAQLTPTTILHVQLMDPTQQSHISLLVSQSNPVPSVILSKDYDFAVSDEPLAPSPVASSSGQPIVFPTVAEKGGNTPQILTPQDEQGFKDQQPLFKGTAVPNGNVEITIQSEQEIKTTVSADANGGWQYRPTTPLAPGNHTITIKTLDANGILKTITQSFVVYAAGSEFTQPSGSPMPTATISPTSQPTALPTNKPSTTPLPTTSTTTATPTFQATTTPSPTQATTLSLSPTNPPIPTTGSTSLIVTIIGIVTLVGVGALLFFFTAV